MEGSQASGDQTFRSPTFGRDGSFHVNEAVGSASISPSGRDVVLASPAGLHIIDLDNPWSPPRHLSHRQSWEVADVQWSPHAIRDYWVVSTSNQKALVWNLNMSTNQSPIEFILHGHTRAITDINFSARHPDLLATCSVDSFVHGWDLRTPRRPAMTFADWFAGASQVKWNRQDMNILASAHDRYLHIWDVRNGAEPVRTIAAHTTKIYGIDWNRTVPTNILTCSLDKSIKLWDYAVQEDVPTRVIRTPYPVWRARHTPFGWGVLAMPQRGDYSLHLYDRRLADGQPRDGMVQPLHSFVGHDDQVKEFLWRTQGVVENGIDSRQFQLVSWSTDKNLLLHRLDDDLMNSVGYYRGQAADKRINFTRKGAIYKTFHDSAPVLSENIPTHGPSDLFRDEASSHATKSSIRIAGIGTNNLHTGNHSRGIRGGSRRTADPIQWMKGVRIGDSLTGESELLKQTFSDAPPWATKESLGDEIAHAGSKYRNITFEEVDVTARHARFSLTGPWGQDGVLTHVKVFVTFPDSYPESASPDIIIEKTSSISDAALKRLGLEIKAVCDAYTDIGRGCLEALMCYLLGEADLDQTVAWVKGIQRAMKSSMERDEEEEESSSDEEDPILAQSPLIVPTQDLETSGTENLGPINSNANVPLPKGCGALWAEDGRLVCFFPTVSDGTLLLSNGNLGSGKGGSRGNGPFESFGFLEAGSRTQRRVDSFASDSSWDSSDSSSFSSTSSSTFSQDGNDTGKRKSQPTVGYSGRPTLSATRSLDKQSSIRTLLKDRGNAGQQAISIQNHDDLVPSKKYLAEEYLIFGSATDVCAHNAVVARKHGLEEISNVWELISLMLQDDVPLEPLPHPSDDTLDVLVLAKRQIVRIKRRDSGLDLAYDNPDLVKDPEFLGRIKWGQHPLGSSWLIPRIFNHFEEHADIQMLAMLSCVLAEPPLHDDPGPRTVIKSKDELALMDKASPYGRIPTFSHDYFPTAEVALDFIRPPLKRHLSIASNAIDDQESITTLNPWSNSGTEVDEFSGSQQKDISPPIMSRQGSKLSQASSSLSQPQSYSSSPDEHIRRSSSMIGNRLAASFSKPFSFITSSSASPPSSQARTPELSTSAPTHAPFAHSWGRSSSFNDTASLRRDESRSSLQYELDMDTSDSGGSETDDEDYEMSVTLKNLENFEDGHTIPLLSHVRESTYRAWREAYAHMLYAWRLPLRRAEVLKFNYMHHAPREASTGVVGLGEEHQDPDATAFAAEQPAGLKLRCAICYELLEGLSQTCLRCGHAAHETCMELLAQHTDNEADYVGLEAGCGTGCGCACDEDSDVGDETASIVAASTRDGEGDAFEDRDASVTENLQTFVRSSLAKG